jgi:NADH-quinone oxidoreductase subunit M
MINNELLLSVVLFLPLMLGIVILFLPENNSRAHGMLALAGSLIILALSLVLFSTFNAASTDPKFPVFVKLPWIAPLNINYEVGLDGISLVMVLMTTIIFPFIVAASLGPIKERTKAYYFLLLTMESAILGTFVSLDLILFYIFYEAMLIPLYFIIGIWGGPKRVAATLKFFLYTMVGSMLMLVSILSLYLMVHSFDFRVIQTSLPAALTALGGHAQVAEMLLFLGFFAAFAVKAPVFPFHTWVPDAYVEAPVAGSIILVALKMGLYGFIRFNLPLFPNATHEAAPIIEILGVTGVIYAAFIACMQTDIKRLIAYSSISHIGVIVVAIFSLTGVGIDGAVLQMFSHTITTGALFLLGGFLFARRGTYDINAYGGVMKVMPVFSTVLLIAVLSSVAMPGTSGFSGEFLMLIGAFQTYPLIAAIATTAAIWSAVYMLWMYQRVMHGIADKPEILALTDLTGTERWAYIAPLIALMILVGVYPTPLIEKITDPVGHILNMDHAPTIKPAGFGLAEIPSAPTAHVRMLAQVQQPGVVKTASVYGMTR